MRGIWTAVVLVALTAICGGAYAGEVERLALWDGMEQWLQGEGQGFAVPAVETSDWIGFVSEGNRVRGTETGDRFRYLFDRAGTFFLGVILVDDPDGVELLKVTLNGRDIGTIVGDDESGKALYRFEEAMPVKPGDALDFTCMVPVGCYRVYELVFAKHPILPPRPSFEHIETWSTEAGGVDICWTTTGIVGTGRIEYEATGLGRESAVAAEAGRNNRIRLRGLDAEAVYQGRIVTTWQGEELASKPFTFRALPESATATKAQTIDLAVPEPTDTARHAWPATSGLPFHRAALAGVGDLRLMDSQGNPVVFQAAATSRWDDGSVKWASLSFLADSDLVGTPGSYQLEAKPGGTAGGIDTAPVLAMDESSEAWELRSSMLHFTIGKKGAAFFERFGFDEDANGQVDTHERANSSSTSGLVLETEDGRLLTCAAPARVDLEENGPVRAVVSCTGKMEGPGGGEGWQYLVRLTFWRGMPGMAVNVSVWNGEEKPLFQRIRRLSVHVPVAGGAGVRGALQGEVLSEVADGEAMRLFQDTDAHYAETRGAELKEGSRALGLATMRHGKGAVSLFLRDFWQTYPSALALDTAGLRVDLLPALASDAYTVEKDGPWFQRLYPWFDDGRYLMRAGQTTRHEFYLWFDTDEEGAAARQHAGWLERPLLPQASPAYLCSTGVLGEGVFAKTPGVWDGYEAFFEGGFEALMAARESNRMYGWMNFGDWYGERGYNAGNNEYDLAWCLGMQWMRTGDRRAFERGLEMARHYATVDTIRGAWSEKLPGVVWEHSFNHVGTRRSPKALGFDDDARAYAKNQTGTFLGGMDPQGHIFEDGVWLYGLLTGDAFLLETAERVCTRQAEFLTPAFDFEIERGGGWPLINATGAYMFTGNPYFLNAARIMVQRCLERHDPEHGGWPHVPPINETLDVPVVGGKAFATGILSFGLLRYLDVEPMDRPDVRRMLINTADWLMNESWEAGNGFVYITNSPKHVGQGHRGHECLMNADIIGFAYGETKDDKYLAFWEEMMAGAFDGTLTGWGKGFSQGTRQTVFGLGRAREAGGTACKSLAKP